METAPEKKLTLVAADQMEHEVVMSYLERARQIWLPAHQKSVRAAGMNAEFASEAKRHMERIDRLLDELNALDYFSSLVSVGDIEAPPAAS
jgi:uncharacterized protein YaeQ